MIGVNLEDDKIVGVGVTTHSETPGLGSRAKTDPAFTAQFSAKPLKETFKLKGDGGQVDALSGATLTSRGVAAAQMQPYGIQPQIKRFSINTVAKTIYTVLKVCGTNTATIWYSVSSSPSPRPSRRSDRDLKLSYWSIERPDLPAAQRHPSKVRSPVHLHPSPPSFTVELVQCLPYPR
ncbi:MAG: FMN-binding protein [Deltaproteobacteria bacterium]|nr:FMN-binding protein [Deltaproteobacteria bacterium]